jgi:hypothetical protein
MGISSSKTTTGPSKKALPFITAASGAVQGAYDANKGNLANISSGLSDVFADYKSGMGASDPTLDTVKAGLGSAFDRYTSNLGQTDPSVASVQSGLGDAFSAYRANMGTVDPTITAAKSRLTDVLGGKYLSGNPQLDAIIGQTNDSVTDKVNAIFSRAGQTGSSRQIGELGKQLSDNEARLRYQNYGDEQARIDAAVAAASGLDAQQAAARNAEYSTLGGLGSTISGIAAQDAATKNAGISTAAGLGSTINGMVDSDAARRNAEIETLLGLGTTAATLPLANADFLANGLGGLWGNATTTKQGMNLGQSLLGAASSAAGAFAASDRRLKTAIEKIGQLIDGLGIYRWTYRDDMGVSLPKGQHVGVMADEVAILRPWALGPLLNGEYATVNYGAL